MTRRKKQQQIDSRQESTNKSWMKVPSHEQINAIYESIDYRGVLGSDGHQSSINVAVLPDPLSVA